MALLRERYPSASVVAGAIRVVAVRTAPGEIRHSGDLAAVQVAPGAQDLAAALHGAGLDVAVRGDEAGLLWDKMCFLAPVALLTTPADVPVGAVRDQRGEELRALVEEVVRVARADGAAADAGKVWASCRTSPPR